MPPKHEDSESRLFGQCAKVTTTLHQGNISPGTRCVILHTGDSQSVPQRAHTDS